MLLTLSHAWSVGVLLYGCEEALELGAVRRFPDGFLWGVATSAYQIEGAVDADGRGPSIWDTFATPGKIDGGGTGDRRVRPLPPLARGRRAAASSSASTPTASRSRGRVSSRRARGREPRGLDHYDRLIDALLERGIEPVVTLYHWDLPQALEDGGGWLARDTVERFAEYARACFDAYGDRVRLVVTINEPWIIGLLGYLHGLHAPGIEDDVLGE